jgi:hypothetical protein
MFFHRQTPLKSKTGLLGNAPSKPLFESALKTLIISLERFATLVKKMGRM